MFYVKFKKLDVALSISRVKSHRVGRDATGCQLVVLMLEKLEGSWKWLRGRGGGGGCE